MKVCNSQNSKIWNSLFIEHGLSLLLQSPEEHAISTVLEPDTRKSYLHFATCLIDVHFNVVSSTSRSFKQSFAFSFRKQRLMDIIYK